ncbi:MAG: TIGR04376 family protein [Gomphosphaeria aponina SAG 52.96 = DSM 107014]|uniref:TIGR04376 family protein n=1 Tax=Gomphosphaeria aponina SAG 52.96 = DSM 107014 TaxID=1521640 RepID=A0A941GS24_9CHRO|nr:TIGR04376 family protein [Gomphosphaeria aponina SAG 52.96 = DSM 107014]
MSIFDDFSKFLEDRLDEFLRNNPHLELQALEEQLQEQEQDTLRLIAEAQIQEKRLQEEILSVAQDIQTWHARVSKAKAAGRLDLANAAQEREAALLRKGNQLWGQMEGAKKRIIPAKELLRQIQQRIKEVKAKAVELKKNQEQTQATSNWDTSGWNQGVNYRAYANAVDPLEQQFERLEVDEELKQMKRNPT